MISFENILFNGSPKLKYGPNHIKYDMRHIIWQKYGCNLTIKSASANNSLFGSVGDGAFAASVTDIVEVNFSNSNVCLVIATKILPAIYISTRCYYCAIKIFKLSELINSTVIITLLVPNWYRKCNSHSRFVKDNLFKWRIS